MISNLILFKKFFQTIFYFDKFKNYFSFLQVDDKGGLLIPIELKVMDSTATSLCMDNNVQLLVFGLDNPENIEITNI